VDFRGDASPDFLGCLFEGLSLSCSSSEIVISLAVFSEETESDSDLFEWCLFVLAVFLGLFSFERCSSSEAAGEWLSCRPEKRSRERAWSLVSHVGFLLLVSSFFLIRFGVEGSEELRGPTLRLLLCSEVRVAFVLLFLSEGGGEFVFCFLWPGACCFFVGWLVLLEVSPPDIKVSFLL